MSEYIVRETGYPGVVKQEIVGELVRCKDCKHSHPWYADRRTCELWTETGVDVFNDGFCSYGERKDDDSHPFADDVMMGEWKDDGDNH